MSSIKIMSVLIAFSLFLPFSSDAKGGGGGGGHSSSGGRSSSSSSRSSSSSFSSSSSSKSSVSSAPKVSSKPSTSTKTVSAPVKTTASGKKTTGKANVVDDSYKPTFRGGYTPPAGSTVQYVESRASFIDYLPWMYIFSQNSRSNVNTQEAVVTEPDGTEKTVEQDEGGDGLLILNWIFMIVLAGGLIWGIMWVVNKFTNRYEYV